MNLHLHYFQKYTVNKLRAISRNSMFSYSIKFLLKPLINNRKRDYDDIYNELFGIKEVHPSNGQTHKQNKYNKPD